MFIFRLVFCLGTVIHSGLSILSNLEHLACTRWTAVVDDFSRLLFSFIQFFFIFKHSNVCKTKDFELFTIEFSVFFSKVDYSCTWKSRSISCYAYRRYKSLCLV